MIWRPAEESPVMRREVFRVGSVEAGGGVVLTVDERHFLLDTE